MPDLALEQDVFVEGFRGLERRFSNLELPWLRQLREESIQRFAELGFPTTHQEDWKYTNLSSMAKIAFQTSGVPSSSGGADGKPALSVVHNFGTRQLESALWIGATRLVFINGRYSKPLSSPGGLPAGVELRTLAEAKAGAEVQDRFARIADWKQRPFVALNTASWLDGAYVKIAKGTVVEQPIQLLFVSSSGGQPWVSHPRTLIVAERDAQAAIVESFYGWGDGASFSNAVTEIVAEENSVIDHYKIQVENERSYHLSTLAVSQQRGSSFASCSVALGSLLARNEVAVTLAGEGVDCTLNGLYLTTGNRHVDNTTTIDHTKPHGTSHEYYKGILDGHSSGVFNGRIIVRKDAQKTDAQQKNKNLLLSADAVIDTKPQLEILADDVRCTHGATIGQIDPEALFYMLSRGIGRREARSLLTYAFAADILDQIRLAPIRECLEGSLQTRLSRSAGGEEVSCR
jgi:Fe-S cluster assembly protein SufD